MRGTPFIENREKCDVKYEVRKENLRTDTFSGRSVFGKRAYEIGGCGNEFSSMGFGAFKRKSLYVYVYLT